MSTLARNSLFNILPVGLWDQVSTNSTMTRSPFWTPQVSIRRPVGWRLRSTHCRSRRHLKDNCHVFRILSGPTLKHCANRLHKGLRVVPVEAYFFSGRRTTRTGFVQRLRTRLDTLPMTVPAMAPCPWAPMMTMS